MSTEQERDSGQVIHALKTRDRELEALVSNVPGGVRQCRNDPELTLLSMSDGLLTLCGCSREELHTLYQDRFINLIYPGDRAEVLRAIRGPLGPDATIELEYRIVRGDGRVLWIFDKGRLVEDGDGIRTFYCLLVDVSGRKREQEELRLSLERHQIIMDQTTDIIFEWDIRCDTLSFSANWQKKYGYAPVSRKITDALPCSKNIHPVDMPAFLRLMRDTAAGVPYSEAEFRICNSAGVFTWSRIRATTQFDADGRPIKAVGVILDIDAEKRHREALLDQAQRDALTGLFNKSATRVRVEECLASSAPQTAHALFIIDLDHFKTVNDLYGHLCGDTVLSETADCLKELFRTSDIVGRIGGDEFLVFMLDIRDRDTLAEKAQAIQRVLHRNHQRDRLDFPLSCSIGIARYPEDAGDYRSLFRCADRALYRVKNAGRKSFAFYSAGKDEKPLPLEAARSAVNEMIDSEYAQVNQRFAQYAFQTLYSAPDIRTAIPQILEIVGRAYEIGRVYIFENAADNRSSRNTFEWCNVGVPSMVPGLRQVCFGEYPGFLSSFDETHLFYCRDIHSLRPALCELLASQETASMLLCAILEQGRFLGFVGFDECRAKRFWTREQTNSLSLIARVLATFLLKLRLEERLNASPDHAPDLRP